MATLADSKLGCVFTASLSLPSLCRNSATVPAGGGPPGAPGPPARFPVRGNGISQPL